MIEANSPTRVDLAGGTLDCWPLFLLLKSAAVLTIQVPISISTRAQLEPSSSSAITLTSSDLNLDIRAKSRSEFLAMKDSRLALFQAVLECFPTDQGFHLTSRSESPVGAGLGGSSSLVMTLLKVFSHWTGTRILDAGSMIRLASNLEARILGRPTGTQDYFPALYESGINVIHYGAREPSVEVIRPNPDSFNSRFLLVYTGRAHNSGINNWDVIKKAIDGDSVTCSALEEISEISLELAQVCRESDWSKLGSLFRRETSAREKLSPGFTSPEIHQLAQIAMQAGAEALKICGAGGGGCVLIWTAAEKWEKVKSACLKKGFQPLEAKPLL